jgi:hypothetical protein
MKYDFITQSDYAVLGIYPALFNVLHVGLISWPLSIYSGYLRSVSSKDE